MSLSSSCVHKKHPVVIALEQVIDRIPDQEKWWTAKMLHHVIVEKVDALLSITFLSTTASLRTSTLSSSTSASSSSFPNSHLRGMLTLPMVRMALANLSRKGILTENVFRSEKFFRRTSAAWADNISPKDQDQEWFEESQQQQRVLRRRRSSRSSHDQIMISPSDLEHLHSVLSDRLQEEEHVVTAVGEQRVKGAASTSLSLPMTSSSPSSPASKLKSKSKSPIISTNGSGREKQSSLLVHKKRNVELCSSSSSVQIQIQIQAQSQSQSPILPVGKKQRYTPVSSSSSSPPLPLPITPITDSGEIVKMVRIMSIPANNIVSPH